MVGQTVFMAEMKHIGILGSTGSIGQNSLEVIANFPDRFRPAFLTTNKNIDLLQSQIQRFKPAAVAVLDECSASVLKKLVNGSPKIFAGEDGLMELVASHDIDVVISSLVGFAGLKPTLEAIRRGKTVALANKETLVVAGEIITRMVREHGATLVPIDSEHSAIMQCLIGEDLSTIDRIILTASGGPFLNTDKSTFANVTIDQALNHPNWKMGSKITIDSATLMNKGLEVIEAHWLFNLPPEKIEVIIHPQSIIHSMVEFVDGSMKAQLGVPDMKIPIQYALTYPERSPSMFRRVNLSEIGQMTFMAPDRSKFECLDLAYRALVCGGTAPAILNAANEVAVQRFLAGEISFVTIPHLVRHALDHVAIQQSPTLEQIVAADRDTRATISSYIP